MFGTYIRTLALLCMTLGGDALTFKPSARLMSAARRMRRCEEIESKYRVECLHGAVAGYILR